MKADTYTILLNNRTKQHARVTYARKLCWHRTYTEY